MMTSIPAMSIISRETSWWGFFWYKWYKVIQVSQWFFGFPVNQDNQNNQNNQNNHDHHDYQDNPVRLAHLWVDFRDIWNAWVIRISNI